LADVKDNFLIDGTVTTHLFTGCDHDAYGVVGLAFVGCLSNPCAGVNNIKADWGTFAHELGHNFNGGHSFEEGQGETGGIMDYGDNMHDGYIQFNSDYRTCGMCTEIGQARRNKVKGFARTGSGLLFEEAPSPDDESWDKPRGCGCAPLADTLFGPEGPPWQPASIGCAEGAAVSWCKYYQWFRSSCETTCAAQDKLVTFSCFKDVDNPESKRKVAWWETESEGTIANPMKYTAVSGCPSRAQMDAVGVNETEPLSFRCCTTDDAPNPKGHDVGVCDRGKKKKTFSCPSQKSLRDH